MNGSSKVIMGTTIAIVVLLVVVLGLVLVLLAELYYSLLFRRRKSNRATKPAGSVPERPDAPQLEQVQDHRNVPSPLSSFYAQGVLEAPRRFLFPKLPSKREHRNKGNDSDNDIEKLKHGKLCKFLRVQSPQQIGIPSSSLSSVSSPSPSYISLNKPQKPNHCPNPEIQVEDQAQDEQDLVHNDDGGTKGESLMYISNPIYDNDVAQGSRGDTPFETPGCSPSRSGSSRDDRKEMPAPSSPASLPLSPMKELPEKACSVALSNARSLGSFGSECQSHNNGLSSSSSGSPYTSPSW